MRLWTIVSDTGVHSVHELKGHRGNVHCVAFSKEGMLVSAYSFFSLIEVYIDLRNITKVYEQKAQHEMCYHYIKKIVIFCT